MTGLYGLEIRGATPADGQGLADLVGERAQSVSPRRMAERMEAVRRHGGAVLVAVEWGPPSGAIALSWAPSLCTDSPIARITLLKVRPEARRRGVGRLLLKAAGQAARAAGCDVLQLSAPPGHLELEAFCRAAGFGEAGDVFERGLRRRS